MENLISIISFLLLIFLFKCSIDDLEITKEKIFSDSSTQEYVIYEETKDRPQYIIDKTINME